MQALSRPLLVCLTLAACGGGGETPARAPTAASPLIADLSTLDGTPLRTLTAIAALPEEGLRAPRQADLPATATLRGAIGLVPRTGRADPYIGGRLTLEADLAAGTLIGAATDLAVHDISGATLSVGEDGLPRAAAPFGVSHLRDLDGTIALTGQVRAGTLTAEMEGALAGDVFGRATDYALTGTLDGVLRTDGATLLAGGAAAARTVAVQSGTAAGTEHWRGAFIATAPLEP